MIEKLLIFLSKKLKVNLLSHAHIQIGIAGYNDFDHTGEKKALELISTKNLNLSAVFDVGANDGSYSGLLAEIFPDANIYAFEPVTETYEIAQKALAGINNVSLFKIGLYKENTTLNIYNDSKTPNNQISSIYAAGLQDFYSVSDLQKNEIVVKTLDTFCEENSIDAIDFIKIDVEGAELDVLKGAENLIKNDCIKLIQFEFNDFNISSRTFIKDFYDTLKNHRFYRITAKGLYDMGKYTTDHEIFKYQNILAVHSSINLLAGK